MIYSRRLVVGSCAAVMLGAGLLPALRAEAAPQNLGAVAAASEEPTAVAAGDATAAATVDLSIDGVTGDICVQSTITRSLGQATPTGLDLQWWPLTPLPIGPVSSPRCRPLISPPRWPTSTAAPLGWLAP